jgi:hypothetical protein
MKTAILAGAIVAVLAANVYLYIQLDRVRKDVTKLRESVLTEITNLRETSSVTNQTARRHIDSLKEELESTRRQANNMASQAKAEACPADRGRAKEAATGGGQPVEPGEAVDRYSVRGGEYGRDWRQVAARHDTGGAAEDGSRLEEGHG